jgi:hypothetical protein
MTTPEPLTVSRLDAAAWRTPPENIKKGNNFEVEA